METLASTWDIASERSLFKSYYVVWKPQDFVQHKGADRLFKSYYVVWKHFRKNCRNWYKKRFKSYYVVWKQKKVINNNNIIIMFKSYYVVWKPSLGGLNQGRVRSLNRTMQYGNKYDFSDGNSIKRCLNRTMQYGNGSTSEEKEQYLLV